MKNRFTLLPRDFSFTSDRELGFFGVQQKKLLNTGATVPKCAVIPLKTLKSIAAANSIPEKISKILVHTNFNDPVACTKLKKTIYETITQAKVPKEILQELGEIYHTYFAGESLTIFTSDGHVPSKQKIAGDATIFKTLLHVWAESTSATLFRSNARHIHPPLLAQPIILQEVTQPSSHGLVYSRHPKTGIKTSVCITVSSTSKPQTKMTANASEYEVDIRTWNIISRPHRAPNEVALLDDNKVIQLAKIGNNIKKQYLEHKCISWELVRNTIVVTGFEDFHLSDIQRHSHTTMTAVYISAGNPQLASEYAELPITGIGYLKSEYTLLLLGSHPLSIIRSGRKNLIEKALVRTLSSFGQVPNIAHIIYKAFDIPANDLLKLPHATTYETSEENAWLGVRGAGKALLDSSLLEAEIHALISFSKESNTRISLLLPFVRSASELHRLLRFTQTTDLNQTKIETWMQIATLEPLLTIQTYPLEHIHGISVQLDTIVQLILGVSPTHTYRDEYVLDSKVLQSVLQPFFTAVRTHAHANIPIHIQMEQYNPKFAQLATKLGAHAITVRPAVAPLAKACIIDTEAAPFRAASESSSKKTSM